MSASIACAPISARRSGSAAISACETIFAPAPPLGERDGGEAEWRALGRELAQLGARGERRRPRASAGTITIGNTRRPPTARFYLDVMFAEAPDLLWQPDLAWIVRGGGDPVAELGRHASRVVAVPHQGYRAARAMPRRRRMGRSGPRRARLDRAAGRHAEAGVELFVVEHDKPNDVARFARRAAETVSRWA